MSAPVVVHWMCGRLNEGWHRTACGLDLYEHPGLRWLNAQNEANCKRCLSVRSVQFDPDDPDTWI